MLVTVEQLVAKIMKEYGFDQILRDHDLSKSEVIQVLHDHGYLDLDRYEDEDGWENNDNRRRSTRVHLG